jgi:hypothetical protein
MKTRKRLILVALVLVLVAALVAQAIMSGGLSGFTRDPNVAALVAQTTASGGHDQSRACIEKASPTGNTTDRRSFVAGALFAQAEMTKMQMQNEALRARCDRKHILHGLQGVQVTVEAVNPKAEKYGLTEQVLQTETELRLRQHGIRILTDEEVDQSLVRDFVEHDKKRREILSSKYCSFEESLGQSDEHFLQCLREVIQYSGPLRTPSPPPYLYINVNTVVSEESHRAAFSVDVQLKEVASVCRNGAACVAAIWERSGVGVSSLSDLKEYVRESLRDHLDEFINAYLAANPKDRSPRNEP